MSRRLLPLFPLPNVVHFPRTELRLHIFEPRYRQLVRDLLEEPEEERRIGMVLMRPGQRPAARQPIFTAGTAGRLVAVDPLPEGRFDILLRGEFRFEVEKELEGRPYRRATVRPVEEPAIQEMDPGVIAVRSELLDSSRALAAELGERFPLSSQETIELDASSELEPIVNALAARLDLPVERKVQMLADPLPERALQVLSVLRSRRKVLNLLRPFRHLEAGAATN